MPSNCKRLSTTVFAIAILFIAGPASADLYSATNSYQKHDFGTAFEQFKELADLGQPQAQFNLAVMYYHGDGVPVSLTYAHAWAALAGAVTGAVLGALIAPPWRAGTGALVGAVMGAVAGPIGVVTGGVFGGAVGLLAGVVGVREDDRALRRAMLDDEIGIRTGRVVE